MTDTLSTTGLQLDGAYDVAEYDPLDARCLLYDEVKQRPLYLVDQVQSKTHGLQKGLRPTSSLPVDKEASLG